MVGMLLLGIVGRSYGFGVSNNMRSGNAFHTTTSSRISTPTLNRPTTTSSSSLNAFSMEDVSHLYEVYPLQSAMVTCGVKASVADAIAQVQAFLKVQSDNEDENAKGEEFLLEINRPDASRRSVLLVVGSFLGFLDRLIRCLDLCSDLDGVVSLVVLVAVSFFKGAEAPSRLFEKE